MSFFLSTSLASFCEDLSFNWTGSGETSACICESSLGACKAIAAIEFTGTDSLMANVDISTTPGPPTTANPHLACGTDFSCYSGLATVGGVGPMALHSLGNNLVENEVSKGWVD